MKISSAFLSFMAIYAHPFEVHISHHYILGSTGSHLGQFIYPIHYEILPISLFTALQPTTR